LIIKDVNLLRTVPVHEQRSIQQWYRVNLILCCVCVAGMALCHIAQWCMWYIEIGTQCAPLCASHELCIKEEEKGCSEFLHHVRTYELFRDQSTQALGVWVQRLHYVFVNMPSIESLILTQCELQCTLRCSSLAQCIDILKIMRTNTDFGTIRCTSITPMPSTQAWSCVITGSYEKRSMPAIPLQSP
jgi:hypothetical protein